MFSQAKETYKEGVAVARPVAGKSRISWVDHARGIAIMLVVYRHVVIGLQRSGVVVTHAMFNAQEVFYNFRMPVFFILSGIFVAGSLRRRSGAEVFRDRAYTILYPYLVWGVIMMTLELCFSRFTNSKRTLMDYVYILTQPRDIDQLWYLFALFNSSALFLLLRRLVRPVWLHVIVAAALHAATFTPFLKGDSLVSDAFFYYPYFYLGTLASATLLDRTKADQILKFSHMLWVLPVFLLGQWFWFTHRHEEYSYWPLFFFISLVACYFVYLIAHGIERRGHDWLSWLGKYSLYIYILHVPVAALLRVLMAHSGLALNTWIEIAVCWSFGLLIPVLLYTNLKRFGFAKLFSLKEKSGP